MDQLAIEGNALEGGPIGLMSRIVLQHRRHSTAYMCSVFTIV